MRQLILRMQVSLDGYVEGPNAAMDWFDTEEEEQWKDLFETLESADALLLGRGMYQGYADYWRAALTDPKRSKNHVRFARLAQETPHFVFSKTLKTADWRNTTIRKGELEDEIQDLKRQPGKDMIAWGGASFAAALVVRGLVDEYRLVVNPVVLGGGKAIFGKPGARRLLKFAGSKSFGSGAVLLRYTKV